MYTRAITGFELADPGVVDYVLLEMHPLRMRVTEAPGLAQIVQETINEHLGRDAVRVTARIARMEHIYGA